MNRPYFIIFTYRQTIFACHVIWFFIFRTYKYAYIWLVCLHPVLTQLKFPYHQPYQLVTQPPNLLEIQIMFFFLFTKSPFINSALLTLLAQFNTLHGHNTRLGSLCICVCLPICFCLTDDYFLFAKKYDVISRVMLPKWEMHCTIHLHHPI